MYQLSYIAVVMQHKKHREPHTYTSCVYTRLFQRVVNVMEGRQARTSLLGGKFLFPIYSVNFYQSYLKINCLPSKVADCLNFTAYLKQRL